MEERLPDENGIYLATCDDAEVPVKQMRYEKDVKPNGLFYDVYGIYDGKVYKSVDVAQYIAKKFGIGGDADGQKDS